MQEEQIDLSMNFRTYYSVTTYMAGLSDAGGSG